MAKKARLLFLLALCSTLTLAGCRKKVEETESETQTETTSETETESETETTKETEKKTSSTNKTSTSQKTTEKTVVKPKTVTSNTTTTTTPTTEAASSYGTEQCPYCFQQISLQPNADGSTVYSVHVAQEKSWADTYGYGDTPPANQQTDAPQTNAPQTDAPQTDAPSYTDVAQCGYCYQWFTVSDGSYSAHLAAENDALGLPQGTEYVQCPTCGYSFPKGNSFDNHICVPAE